MLTDREPAAAARRRALVLVAGLTLLVQLASATWWVTAFRTPNASTKIARILVETGRYEGGYGGLLKGQKVGAAWGEPRMFQLPGEALYLFLWFRFVPERLHRYAHVGVTVLLVTSVACVAAVAVGPMAGLFTGLLAAFQPFIVKHGPVWDDTVFSAALVWLVIGALLTRIKGAGSGAESGRGRLRARLAVICGVAGFAALLRTEAQAILMLLAVSTFIFPSMRQARAEGAVIALGVALALGGWGLRNRAAVGEFSIGSSHDGVVLLLSNGPYTKRAIGYGQMDSYGVDETLAAHWARIGAMSEPEVNRHFRQQALAYIMSHPGDVFTTALLKLAVTLAGIRPEEPLLSARNLSATVASGLLWYLAICFLFLYGWRGPLERNFVLSWMMAVVVFVVLATVAAGPIGWRYRITLDGVLWLAGGAVLARTWEWINSRRIIGGSAERNAVRM